MFFFYMLIKPKAILAILKKNLKGTYSQKEPQGRL